MNNPIIRTPKALGSRGLDSPTKFSILTPVAGTIS